MVRWSQGSISLQPELVITGNCKYDSGGFIIATISTVTIKLSSLLQYFCLCVCLCFFNVCNVDCPFLFVFACSAVSVLGHLTFDSALQETGNLAEFGIIIIIIIPSSLSLLY